MIDVGNDYTLTFIACESQMWSAFLLLFAVFICFLSVTWKASVKWYYVVYHAHFS
jgi:hypothetical protein